MKNSVKNVSLVLSKKELEVLIKWENIIFNSWKTLTKEHPELTSDDYWELFDLIDYKLYAREKHNEKSKKRMQEYRSTPDGLKKSRESSKKSIEKLRHKKILHDALTSIYGEDIYKEV